MKKKGLAYRKEAGFKVPEGYFQDFDARLMTKLEAAEIDKKLADKENPFSVPDLYFEKFEDRLLQKIQEEKRQPKVLNINFNRQWYYLSAVAAVVIVLLTTTFINVSEDYSFEELDVLAIENYLFETLDYNHPEETFLVEENDFSWVDPVGTGISDEALLEYLEENIEEPSILFNEN